MRECPVCDGDGKERCDNPDHEFIAKSGSDTGRLGCPVCGHDPFYRVPDGGDCFICEGSGQVSEAVFIEWTKPPKKICNGCKSMDYWSR